MRVSPGCGQLSVMDASNKIIPGTLITITGGGFKPGKETEVWWVDPIGNDFRMRQAGQYVEVMADPQGGFEIQVNMPFSVLQRLSTSFPDS